MSDPSLDIQSRHMIEKGRVGQKGPILETLLHTITLRW